MGLRPSAIRQRIAAAIEAVSGWTESRVGYDRFGLDTRHLAHLGFAVGVPSTAHDDRDRQRRDRGVLSQTQVGIRWSHQLRAGAHVSDYDAALDAEIALVAALTDVNTDPALAIRLQGIPSRSASADGLYFLGELSLVVQHTYPLSG